MPEVTTPPSAESRAYARAGRVDCRWPAQRLTVELDSYRYHHSRHAWQQDHRRAREAHARGDDFRRYTWEDVFVDPQAMIAELRELLPQAPFRPRCRGGRAGPRRGASRGAP